MFYDDADTLSNVLCIVHIWFNRLSVDGNMITVTLMALERVITVFHPLNARVWITTFRSKRVWGLFVTVEFHTISGMPRHRSTWIDMCDFILAWWGRPGTTFLNIFAKLLHRILRISLMKSLQPSVMGIHPNSFNFFKVSLNSSDLLKFTKEKFLLTKSTFKQLRENIENIQDLKEVLMLEVTKMLLLW